MSHIEVICHFPKLNNSDTKQYTTCLIIWVPRSEKLITGCKHLNYCKDTLKYCQHNIKTKSVHINTTTIIKLMTQKIVLRLACNYFKM